MPDPTPLRSSALPLVAVFAAGYQAAYLLPSVVGGLSEDLGLSAAEAGAIGSALLLAAALAGIVLASRVDRLGPARLARIGLLLTAVGFATAAASPVAPLVVAGCAVGGFGSGTATAVAAAGIAARPDPHRASVLGLLVTSATAAALYLLLPRLGSGHALPLAAIASVAALVLPLAGRLPGAAARHGTPPAGPLPYRRSGAVLAAGVLCWSLAQNALWGVSDRIGLDRAGLSPAALGVVFAAALGGGLAGVAGAAALGSRWGRAIPIGVGTAAIAVCVTVASTARGPVAFTVGEVLWNVVYPLVLSYLMGLAASLDARGRWAVLVGSASSLGVAAGPLTGTLLSGTAGYPVMGWVLGTALLLVAVPLTAVAVRAGGGPMLLPGAVRRRGGAPAAAVAGVSGAPVGMVPELGGTELRVADIEIASAGGPSDCGAVLAPPPLSAASDVAAPEVAALPVAAPEVAALPVAAPESAAGPLARG